MSCNRENNERAEALMRTAAALFWENNFHTPFPCAERRPSLPSIPEKANNKETVVDLNSPMHALVSPHKSIHKKFVVKEGFDVPPINMPGIRKATSLDEEDGSTTRSSLLNSTVEIKRSFSCDVYDSAKHRRALKTAQGRRRLPALSTKETSLLKMEADQQRARDAIMRADIIHHRREGSLEEFDEEIGFSHSEKSDRLSSPRSNSFKNSSKSTRSCTSTGSSRKSIQGGALDALSVKNIIEQSPALQDAIAANLKLPSFARCTISSLRLSN